MVPGYGRKISSVRKYLPHQLQHGGDGDVNRPILVPGIF